jgi:esterase
MLRTRGRQSRRQKQQQSQPQFPKNKINRTKPTKISPKRTFAHSTTTTTTRKTFTREEILQGQLPVELNFRKYAAVNTPNPTQPPLIILHGLLGHANNWTNIAGRNELKNNRDIYTIDLRNHGFSPHTDYTDYVAMSNDIANFIQKNCPNGVATVVGHSMGGKATAALGLLHPHVVTGLVLVDILPVNYSEQNMQEINNILDTVVDVDFSNGAGRKEIDAQLAKNISEVGIRQWLLTNITSIDDNDTVSKSIGAINKWKPNVKGLQNCYHNIRQFDLQQDHLWPYNGPVQLILGGKSSFGNRQNALDIMNDAQFPETELAVIEGAGHWCHAEKPNEFSAALAEFLQKHHL